MKSFKKIELLAISFGFVSFIFIREWILFAPPEGRFYVLMPQYYLSLISFVSCLLVLTIVVSVVLSIFGKSHGKKTTLLIILFLLMVFPFLCLRNALNLAVIVPFVSLGYWKAKSLLSVFTFVFPLSLLSIYLFIKFSRFIQGVLGWFFTSGAIFGIIYVISIISMILDVKTTQISSNASVKLSQINKKRVVFLLFDELAEEYLEPGKKLPLKNFKALKNESFIASHVYPPGYLTMHSIPIYLTGKTELPTYLKSDKTTRSNPFSLMGLSGNRYFSADTITALTDNATVFRDAKELGYRSGVVGFYIPYCRMSGQSLNECLTFGSFPGYQYGNNIVVNMRRVFQRTFTVSDEHDHVYKEVHEKGISLASNADIDFAYIHWPIPHLPGLYSINRTDTEEDYLENVKLADKALGDLITALKEKDLWNSTTLIITSDHPIHGYRCWKGFAEGKYDKRIPFIVKLAGDNTPYLFNGKMNTVLMRPLLNFILQSDNLKATELANWISSQPYFDPVTAVPTINACTSTVAKSEY